MEKQKEIEKYNQSDDIYEKSRKMIIRCYHAIASQQQLSGVQVASYLMKCKQFNIYFFKKILFHQF